MQTSAVEQKRTRLFTTFGTVLYIDTASGKLRHGPNSTSPENLVFVADQSSKEKVTSGWLMHEISSDQILPVACLREYSHSLPHAKEEYTPPPAKFQVIALERGLVGLKCGEFYLCAEALGLVTLSRRTCSVWECFLPSEDWCADFSAVNEKDETGPAGKTVDRRQIKRFIIDPMLRAKSRGSSKSTKILIFANTEWSNGRVYYDLCKALYEKGYLVDILNWRVSYTRQHFSDLMSYYDFVLSGLDGIPGLFDNYGIPYEKIIGISHGIYYDLPLFLEKKGLEVLEKLANFGVVSYSMISESVIAGIRRIPLVISLGVAYSEFYTEISDRLTTVGYATAISHKTKNGIEKKRGGLAEACARAAGLTFTPAGTYSSAISFHDMPEYYKKVDAVLMTSLIEAAGLPALEAAAAGRLVIGTPVGHFPLRAYQGGGIIAPIEERRFKEFTINTLRYYRENSSAYVEKCHAIKHAAQQINWKYVIEEWVELIETAKH